MKVGKVLLLLVLLGAPVLTYVFLKSFGKNYYDLPRYNPSAITNTGDTIYATLPTELASVVFQKGKSIYVLNASFDSCENSAISKSVSRVLDFFQEDKAVAIRFFADSIQTNRFSTIQSINLGYEKSRLLSDFLFGFELPLSILKNETNPDCQRLRLMDGNGYIRGVYAIETMEEADRLILEIKVLKSQLN
jgi:hypothetical protein